MKNAYVGRTFIQPSQTIRQLGIRLKLNPLRDVIRGKRLVVVDDSIVRGNTQRALVRMLREAGAVEVHVRISSPPVKWPCFYGIDFATPRRADRQRAGRRRDPRVDRRRLAGLHLARRRWSRRPSSPRTGCAGPASTASTRSTLPEPELLGKHLLEGLDAVDVDGLGALVGGGGAVERAQPPVSERTCRRPAAGGAAGDDVRRGRRRRRGRRARRRADEGVGRAQAQPARGGRRPRRVRRPVRRLGAQGAIRSPLLATLHRRGRHQARDRPARWTCTTRSASTWSRMVVDDLVVVRRRAAVPARLHRHRQGRAGADRRDRRRASPRAAGRPAAPWSAARPPSTRGCWRRTSTTSPAPASAWSRPTTSSAPTGSGRRRR